MAPTKCRPGTGDLRNALVQRRYRTSRTLGSPSVTIGPICKLEMWAIGGPFRHSSLSSKTLAASPEISMTYGTPNRVQGRCEKRHQNLHYCVHRQAENPPPIEVF